jgi:transcriptional regulator with XRE-family HTH domain
LFGIVNAITRRCAIANQPRRENETRVNLTSVGKRIATLRQIKNFSLPGLAEAAEVSKGYLWQLENGEDPNPSLAVLMKLATALDTTVAELLGQPAVRAKNLPIPEQLPPGLKDFLDVQKRKGEPVPENIVRVLAQLQARGLKDWEFLYEAIKRTTPGKHA